MSFTSWTQSEAIEFCKAVEGVTRQFGVHIGLTGGCLYHHGIRKDCDLLFYTVEDERPIFFAGLFYALGEIGLRLVSDFGYVIKCTYLEKSVDLLFPEWPGSQEYDQAEGRNAKEQVAAAILCAGGAA